MERLTMIDGCGNHELARCMDCGLEKAGQDLENCGMCEEGWQRALRKLAAYEDTGLEPDDLKKAFNETAILKLAAQALSTTPDHLRDLLQAEQDGRLVVLPCKVGDTVFRVFTVGTRDPVIKETVIKTASEAADLIGRIGKKNMLVSVFRTREEAEAAMAQKGGEG